MTVQVVADEFPEAPHSDAGPYTIMVHLRAKPEHANEVERLLDAQVTQTRAEPGCVTYHLSRDRANPAHFYFFEAYTNLDAFRAHLQTSYIAGMLKELPVHLSADVEMTFLEMVSPFQ